MFFPERHAFSLESAGLDVTSPFYSRRIGLDSEGRPVPVTAGGRVTHRPTRASAGALLLRQAGGGPVDGAMVRGSGGWSRPGTIRGLPADPSALNTVAAVDWFFHPTTNLFHAGVVSRSFTEGSGGDGWAAHAIMENYAPWAT